MPKGNLFDDDTDSEVSFSDDEEKKAEEEEEEDEVMDLVVESKHPDRAGSNLQKHHKKWSWRRPRATSTSSSSSIASSSNVPTTSRQTCGRRNF